MPIDLKKMATDYATPGLAILGLLAIPATGAWYASNMMNRLQTLEAQIQAVATVRAPARPETTEPLTAGDSTSVSCPMCPACDNRATAIDQACLELARQAGTLHEKGTPHLAKGIEDMMSRLGCLKQN